VSGIRFTVVIATYNAAATLQKCLDSVFRQTYRNLEVVVIDGCSTDGTPGILAKNSGYLAYWESKPDKGIYDAWNKGLDHASGDWICFLGADDFFWSPDVLEKMVPYLVSAYPQFRVVYGKVAYVNRRGELLDLIGEPWEKIAKKFLQTMPLFHTGMMHHRDVFERHGKFDASFRIAGDYEFLLRELKASPAMFVPNVIAVGMRVGGISTDPINVNLMLKETRSASVRHGRKRVGIHWIVVVGKVKIRHLLWRLVGEGNARRILDLGRVLLGKRPVWSRT
jgi:glycosyltransferase involved in cell wall biosynthesis